MLIHYVNEGTIFTYSTRPTSLPNVTSLAGVVRYKSLTRLAICKDSADSRSAGQETPRFAWTPNIIMNIPYTDCHIGHDSKNLCSIKNLEENDYPHT